MTGVVSTLGDGLGNAFQMAFEVWWALVLGLAIMIAPGRVPGLTTPHDSGAHDAMMRMH